MQFNRCEKCYHPKDGIVHKVFSSCARCRKKNFKQHNALNNYLNRMELNEDNKFIWFDDYKYIWKKETLSELIPIYDRMLLESKILMEVDNSGRQASVIEGSQGTGTEG